MNRIAKLIAVATLSCLICLVSGGCTPIGQAAPGVGSSTMNHKIGATPSVHREVVSTVETRKPSIRSQPQSSRRHVPTTLSVADRVLELLLHDLELQHELNAEADPARQLQLTTEIKRCREARDALYAADENQPDAGHDVR